MSKIVSVQFQDRRNPDAFCGREYSYLTELELSIGNIVIVPTSSGDGIARVCCADVPESKVDERVMPLLKTIERLYEPDGNNESEVVY